jgi:hypothetical protein
MRFLKFVTGGFLILGSLIFGGLLLLSSPFAAVGGFWGSLIFWGVIDFIAFLSGIYLVIHH